MKKDLIVYALFTMLSCSSAAYADIIMQSYSQNTCADLSGKWAGTGKASNWSIGDCYYHGSGEVQNVNFTNHFTLTITVDKESGSFVCPNHVATQLRGECSNGKMTLKTSYGDLTGNVNEQSGTAEGDLRLSPGLPPAKVTIQLKKMN